MERTKVAKTVKPRTANDPLGRKRKVPDQLLHPPGGSDKILWRKTGGGSLTLASGKKIKKGETFLATVNEIPKAFRDTVIPVNPIDRGIAQRPEPVEEPPLEVEEPEFTVQEDPPDSENFIVLDAQGKIVSEGPLTEEEAEELVVQLKG